MKGITEMVATVRISEEVTVAAMIAATVIEKAVSL